MEARTIKMTLQNYEAASGHLVSLPKSMIFFLNTPKRTMQIIVSILQCSVGSLPSTYLGLPLGANPSPESFWNGLIDKCKAKMDGWKGALLIQARKLVMIKSTL